jgi:biotin carboxyl carrier protein
MAINKFTLMLEGQPYEIERRGDLMIVNGVEFPYAIKEGVVTISGTPKTVKHPSAALVEVDGIAYAIEAKGLEEPKTIKSRKAASAGAAEEAGAVTAIMPGLIIKILKNEGEHVEAGETVMILEAMKMQNDLTAKTSGTIRQMNVKQGENVEMRQVLCIVE